MNMGFVLHLLISIANCIEPDVVEKKIKIKKKENQIYMYFELNVDVCLVTQNTQFYRIHLCGEKGKHFPFYFHRQHKKTLN